MLPIAPSIVAFSVLAGQALAQNLGTYLSLCDSTQGTPYAEIGTDQSYDGLSLTGQCSSSSTPDKGDESCPTPFYEAFFTNTQSYFSCATSLDSTCGGNCPAGTACLATYDGNGRPFYFCGVQCAGGQYSCDNAGTSYLNSNYVPFCDQVQDQCATCASSSYLRPGLNPGDMTCLKTVYALPPRGSAYSPGKRSRRDQLLLAAKQEADLFCPADLTKCLVSGAGNNGTEEYECLDIQNDVHNCGGCPNEHGVDCADLPGIDLGGVTCQAGRCVATHCDDEHTLLQDSCIANGLVDVFKAMVDRPTRTAESKQASKRDETIRERITSRAQLKLKPGQTVEVIQEAAPLPIQ